MQVELADERVLILADRFSMDHAEGRAWHKRVEAFGTMAKLSGFLSRPRDDEYEVVYREHRLQPFWRIQGSAHYGYERKRRYQVAVDEGVREVMLEGAPRAVENRHFEIEGVETCRRDVEREVFFNAVSGAAEPGLGACMAHDATLADAEALNAIGKDGTIVVPPQVKASTLVRDVLAGVIERIDADRVLEETVTLQHVDLYYRPVYAFRYRRAGKEAVVEFDGLTGEARAGGGTFEQYVGRLLEPEFLINAGVETAGIFIPGARLAEIVISRGLRASRTAPAR